MAILEDNEQVLVKDVAVTEIGNGKRKETTAQLVMISLPDGIKIGLYNGTRINLSEGFSYRGVTDGSYIFKNEKSGTKYLLKPRETKNPLRRYWDGVLLEQAGESIQNPTTAETTKIPVYLDEGARVNA